MNMKKAKCFNVKLKTYFQSLTGFTFVELLFVAVLTVLVIGSILSVWTFTYRTWTGENKRTELRINLMNAIETIKHDLRLSSLTYMSFYPESGEPYSAISFPVAVTDASGLFDLNASNEIDWDKTVIYHLYNDGTGNDLRRTVIDPRDNTLSDSARYDQLVSVVSSGSGPAGSTTDTEFLEDMEIFGISSLAPVIDFYEDSATAVRAGKIVFGWVKLVSGNHTIRFEITGQNAASTGFNIGLDTITIEPSGSVRDVEYYNSSYAPSGMFTESGGTSNRVYNSLWTNKNYLEFNANGAGDYIEIVDSYDLWRESAFENAALNTADLIEEEVRAGLFVPGDDDFGTFTWFAYEEAGDVQQEGIDVFFPGTMPRTFRTVITQEKIYGDGDLIRVKFQTYEGAPLLIEKAYITRVNAAADAYDGLPNVSPAGKTPEEFHMHQQLFFKDTNTDEIVEYADMPADSEEASEMWSVWTAFPIRNDSNYVISYHVPYNTKNGCKLWTGSTEDPRTYYVNVADATIAGTPDWGTAGTVGKSPNVYAVADIAVENTAGSVESQVFDTAVSAPAYNNIKWSEDTPSGTDVLLKARSSSDKYMSGAPNWSSISGSSANPHSLSIGNGRYVQFLADLIGGVYWAAPGTQLSYADYVTAQMALAVYQFPASGGGEPLVTTISAPWVDDIEIDWPGVERICTFTGYIARRNDYGQAKLLVDGNELVKILSIHVKLLAEIQGRLIEEENYVDVEPRNTGK